jgi:hypothetical protein
MISQSRPNLTATPPAVSYYGDPPRGGKAAPAPAVQRAAGSGVSYYGEPTATTPLLRGRSGQATGGTGLSARLDAAWDAMRTTLRGQFIALGGLIVVLACVQALSSSSALAQAGRDLDAIGTASVPSLDAAQAMGQYLEDMDARAADYLATGALTDRVPCAVVGPSRDPGPIPLHDCDALNIEAETMLFNAVLYNAAHSGTYPGERTAVERITAGFQEYTAALALMRHEWELAADKSAAADPHMQAARAAYQAANNIWRVQLTQMPPINGAGRPLFNEPVVPDCVLPDGRALSWTVWPLGSMRDNVDCLSYLNKNKLDAAYTDTNRFLGDAHSLAMYLGIAFIFALAGATWRMARITHRAVNIGLLGALLVGTTLSLAVALRFATMDGSTGEFHSMVRNSYDSVYEAAVLKRSATAAAGAQARWLLARAAGDQAAADTAATDWKTNVGQVNAYISLVRDNRTWADEDTPLVLLRTNWEQYAALDDKIRTAADDMTDPQRIITAEQLSAGDSHADFVRFLSAVDDLSSANRSHYSKTYNSAQDNLHGWLSSAGLLFPLIGLAAAWGIGGRLKDF